MTSVNELKEIHYMRGYGPFEPQYARYVEKPEIIAAGYKIVDVYTAICQARSHLSYYECNDFGELSNKDEISMKWIKSQMITDSIFYYNIAIDLSLQVIWAFYQSTSLKFLYSNKYEEISKECTLEAVNSMLNYRIETENVLNSKVAKEIKEKLNDFVHDEVIDEIHQVYNYLKHRGGCYIDGLGCNNSTLMISINHKKIPLLHRPELDMVEIYKKLLKFDERIIAYFEFVINKIMPKDYMEKNMPINIFARNYHKILDAIE